MEPVIISNYNLNCHEINALYMIYLQIYKLKENKYLEIVPKKIFKNDDNYYHHQYIVLSNVHNGCDYLKNILKKNNIFYTMFNKTYLNYILIFIKNGKKINDTTNELFICLINLDEIFYNNNTYVHTLLEILNSNLYLLNLEDPNLT